MMAKKDNPFRCSKETIDFLYERGIRLTARQMEINKKLSEKRSEIAEMEREQKETRERLAKTQKQIDFCFD